MRQSVLNPTTTTTTTKYYAIFLSTLFFNLVKTVLYRDANFYRLPVVTTENCENVQFSKDYGKLKLFYGKF